MTHDDIESLVVVEKTKQWDRFFRNLIKQLGTGTGEIPLDVVHRCWNDAKRSPELKVVSKMSEPQLSERRGRLVAIKNAGSLA